MMKLPLSPRVAKALTFKRSKISETSSSVAPDLPTSRKLGSHLHRIRPRRATILAGVKITATAVGQVGSAAPVPFIQPIAEGVKKIVEHCEVRELNLPA